MANSKIKYALRLSTNPATVQIVEQADGSLVFVPKPGTRSPELMLQVVPITDQIGEEITIGVPEATHTVVVRDSPKPMRRRLWISR